MGFFKTENYVLMWPRPLNMCHPLQRYSTNAPNAGTTYPRIPSVDKMASPAAGDLDIRVDTKTQENHGFHFVCYGILRRKRCF